MTAPTRRACPLAGVVVVVVVALSLVVLPRGALAQSGAGGADASCDRTLAQQLVGTWLLQEASTPGSPSGIGTRLKMFTGTHWAVVQPRAETGVIVFQHGGRYRVEGETLHTTHEFAGENTRAMIGRAGQYSIRVEGDTMVQVDHSGTFNERWTRVR